MALSKARKEREAAVAAETQQLEGLIQEAVVTGSAPDLKKDTAAVGQAHMTSSDRQIRTELTPDGGIVVYKNGEFRMPNGDVYIGETLNEKRHGRGTYYFVNGDVYVGEFEAGIFYGQGVLRKAPFREAKKDCVNRSYAGGWKNGFREGTGKYHTGFGDFYEGTFEHDAYHGTGIMVYANGDRYSGGWSKGKWHGEGELVHPNATSYVGCFFKGMFHGEGMFRYGPEGGSYAGGWRLGMKHGIGKRKFASGAEYEGEYAENAMCGKGIYKSAIGDLYVGTFKDSVFHGEGTWIKCTGDRYRGQFQRGQPAGIGRWEYERGGYYDGEFLATYRTGIPYRPKQKWVWEGPAAMLALWKELQQTAAKAAEEKKKRNEAAVAAEIAAKAQREVARSNNIKNKSHHHKKGGSDAVDSSVDKTTTTTETSTSAPKKKLQKPAEKFFAPLLVGSPEDEAYLRSSGKDTTTTTNANGLVPAADGLPHGKGVRVYADMSRYEGEWYQGAQQGFGVYIGAGATGVRYEGTWVEGKRSGTGVQSYGNNDGVTYVCPLGNQHDGSARCFYDGEWKSDFFWGEGSFTCCDGRQYAGGWYKGKRHGQGRWVMLPAALHYSVRLDASGSITSGAGPLIGEYGQIVKFDDVYRVRVYEGTFVKNKRTGKGKATLNNGDVLEGPFVVGRLDGLVRVTFGATGKITYARYRMGNRYAWIAGAELERLLKKDEEEAKAAIEKEEKRVKTLARLGKSNMFSMGTEVKARAHGQVLAIEMAKK